jgi:hypothetical protein
MTGSAIFPGLPSPNSSPASHQDGRNFKQLTKGNDMRLTLILGLDHVERDIQHLEVMRILDELTSKLADTGCVNAGDMHILRDMNGNRVGVADVTDN